MLAGDVSVIFFETCNVSQVMEGLDHLKELQQLWLGRNRIQSVNLGGLTSLLKISLQSNRLTSMLAFQVSVW